MAEYQVSLHLELSENDTLQVKVVRFLHFRIVGLVNTAARAFKRPFDIYDCLPFCGLRPSSALATSVVPALEAEDWQKQWDY
jgi:hypothetical protein